MSISRTACLKNYGKTEEDEKYFICVDGKYDGYITSGPAKTLQKVAEASSLSIYGQPSDSISSSLVSSQSGYSNGIFEVKEVWTVSLRNKKNGASIALQVEIVERESDKALNESASIKFKIVARD